MPFAVLFQKMDSNLGVIIIGAEVKHSDASTIGATMCYLGGNEDGAEVRVRYL
jgi:hypothetical protein